MKLCLPGLIKGQKSPGKRFFCKYCLHGHKDSWALRDHLRQKHHKINVAD